MLPQLPPSNGCGSSGTVIYSMVLSIAGNVDDCLIMGE